MFSPKSPFQALFGAFYPHPAHNPRCERKGLLTSWHPVNVGAPPSPWPLFSRLPPPAPRRRPSGPAGSGHEPTLPRWLLFDADTRIGKERAESDLDDRLLSISMAPNRAILTAKTIRLSSLAAARSRDHSLTVGGASASVAPGLPAISRNAYFLMTLPDFPEYAPAVSSGVPGTLQRIAISETGWCPRVIEERRSAEISAQLNRSQQRTSDK